MALALLVVPGVLVLLAMLALVSPAAALAVVLLSALVYLSLCPSSPPPRRMPCDDAPPLYEVEAPKLEEVDYSEFLKKQDAEGVAEPKIPAPHSGEPIAANDADTTVRADDTWDHPDLRLRQIEQHLYKGPESDVDKQRREMRKHLMARRQLAAENGGRWSDEDRAKLRESRVAAMKRLDARLKPDHAVVYEQPEHHADNPPVQVGMYDDPKLFNSRRVGFGMDGSNQLADLLRTRQM